MKHLSKEQIEEIRKELLSQRERILKHMSEQIQDPSNVVFEGGDEIDRADLEEGRYITFRITGREAKLLKKIDYALSKIEQGTFGVCEMCGEEIPYERLRARPVTTMCIKCKEYEEEQEHE